MREKSRANRTHNRSKPLWRKGVSVRFGTPSIAPAVGAKGGIDRSTNNPTRLLRWGSWRDVAVRTHRGFIGLEPAATAVHDVAFRQIDLALVRKLLGVGLSLVDAFTFGDRGGQSSSAARGR